VRIKLYFLRDINVICKLIEDNLIGWHICLAKFFTIQRWLSFFFISLPFYILSYLLEIRVRLPKNQGCSLIYFIFQLWFSLFLLGLYFIWFCLVFISNMIFILFIVVFLSLIYLFFSFDFISQHFISFLFFSRFDPHYFNCFFFYLFLNLFFLLILSLKNLLHLFYIQFWSLLF